jgi:DNA-binding response OmpR family regulator
MTELKRVVCVDDDPSMLLILDAVLQTGAGLEIRGYSSGQEALDALEEEPAQLVLLDVSMPDMDGLETARRLRKTSHGLTVPIAFLTGRTEPHDLDRYRREGVKWIIPKPFDMALLPLQVNAIWRNAGQSAGA